MPPPPPPPAPLEAIELDDPDAEAELAPPLPLLTLELLVALELLAPPLPLVAPEVLALLDENEPVVLAPLSPVDVPEVPAPALAGPGPPQSRHSPSSQIALPSQSLSSRHSTAALEPPVDSFEPQEAARAIRSAAATKLSVVRFVMGFPGALLRPGPANLPSRWRVNRESSKNREMRARAGTALAWSRVEPPPRTGCAGTAQRGGRR